jgi:sulfate permease, SulP family
MLLKLFPGLNNLVPYQASNLAGDLTAGIVVTFLLLPQSMAYAMIAGVPLSMGLIAGTFPLMIYAVFGSSKYLSVGPASVVSLLAFSGVSGVTGPDSEQFLEMMFFLVLLVGLIQLILGLLRVGSLLGKVSRAVIGGFISAVAVIIMLNQLSSFLGITLPKYENFLSFIFNLIQNLSDVNALATSFGIGSIIALLLFKRRFKVSPGPFLVIVISILVVDFLNLNKMGVDIVGQIPHEFQEIALFIPSSDILFTLLPTAIIISFISFFESFSVASTLAEKEQEKINPNQELIGLGFANLTGSFVGSIPVAGAISRTAVNYQAGARTNLSLVITASFMLLAIFYITPLFYYLPQATLAGIIIFAVWNLVNVKQIKYLLRYEPFDAVIFLMTFFATLVVDVFFGLVIGIALSLWKKR